MSSCIYAHKSVHAPVPSPYQIRCRKKSFVIFSHHIKIQRPLLGQNGGGLTIPLRSWPLPLACGLLRSHDSPPPGPGSAGGPWRRAGHPHRSLESGRDRDPGGRAGRLTGTGGARCAAVTGLRQLSIPPARRLGPRVST